MLRAVRNSLDVVVALIAGAVCLLVSLSGEESARPFSKATGEAYGTIVRTWQQESRAGSRMQNWVEVEFLAADGRRYTVREKLRDQLWTTLAAGMEMPVTYVEANPAASFIGAHGSSTRGSLSFALAFVCFAVAVWQIWRSLAIPPTRALAVALHEDDEGDAARLLARRLSQT